jgi:membrane protease YdiL (CAAX protease family)
LGEEPDDIQVGMEPTASRADDPSRSSAPPRRFCGTCGTPWQADWIQCQGCIAFAQREQHTAASQLSVSRDLRSVRNAMALYGAMLAVSIVSILIVIAQKRDLELRGLVVESVCFSLIVILWSIGARSTLRPPLRTLGPLRWTIAAPLLGIVTFAVASASVSGMTRLFELEQIVYLDVFDNAGYGLGLGILLIAVQPAVIEELAFRGMILGWLHPVVGATQAMLVSAAMFAILHLSGPSIPHLFVLGLALAWLRGASHSLYPGMIVHFTHNLLCLVDERSAGMTPW